MQTIKTITLHEPWSSYIRDGFKRFETRHWETPYRGLLAIHAGKTVNREMVRALADEFPELAHYEQYEFKTGVVAICRLINCWPVEKIWDELHPLEDAVGNYSPERFGWELQVLEKFDIPIEAKGQQGIWDWQPPDGFFDKRVAIVGSRKFDNPHVIDEYVQLLPSDTIVVSGGADGADKIAEYAARHRGLKVISIPVLEHEWDLHKNPVSGKSYAGMIRNQAIVDMAGTVVAFQRDDSPGTADTLKKAKAAGKKVVVNPHEKEPQSPVDDSASSERYSRDSVLPIAQEFARLISIACDELQIAGSLRRHKPDVKDAELVAVPKFINGENALNWVLDRLLEEGHITLAKLGKTGQTRWGDQLRSWEYKGVKFDLFTSEAHNFGIQYQLKTGSRDFNVYLMTRLKDAPFQLKKFVAYWLGTPLYIPDEKTWFELLGLPNIVAVNRNVDYLKLMFSDKHWNGWGNPKEFLPKAKQLSFGGDFVNMNDEGAVIDYLIDKKKLDKHAASKINYKWDKPWLIEAGYVWVEDKALGFKVAEIGSYEAMMQARKLAGFFAYEYTRKLYDWFDEKRGWLPMPFEVIDVGELGLGYLLSEGAQREIVPLELIAFTQDTYHLSHIRKYLRNPSPTDEEGNYPFGIRFSDSHRVYLMNGHHRILLAKWQHQATIELDVCTYPETFAQACNFVEDDGMDRLEFFADVLEEVATILDEAKREKAYA